MLQVKNQFMRKRSQDGLQNSGKQVAGQLSRDQNSMPAIGGKQSMFSTPDKSGFLGQRKTGQRWSPESEAQKINQVNYLPEETELDPLSHRQMPRIVSTQPPMPPAPTVNSFSAQANDITMMHQSSSPHKPPYPSSTLESFPGAILPGNLTSFPGATLSENIEPPHRYLYNTGQRGNPNPMSYGNFDNVPSGFVPPSLMKPRRRGSGKRKHLPLWARIMIAVVAFLVITGGSAFAYYEFTIGKSVADITGNSATHKLDGKNQVIQGAAADPLTTRTNIMLLGSDTDGKYPGQGGNDPTTGQPLAQTVMIITIDPTKNYVGMLSIPRDMQITDTTTGYANEKLDQAFEHAWVGQTNKDKAAAAAGHMEDIIQQNYGIHINHYAWVGLQGFTKVVNDIGGVDIDVTHPMFDDDYPNDTGSGSKYGFTRVNIVPGPQHLTGAEALTYVRTRHADLGGDFGRTDRQQQVLTQIKAKLTQSDDIVSKMTSVINDLDGYMFTDLTLGELSRFSSLAKEVDINKIDHVSFTNNYSTPAASPSTNVLPKCAAINAEIQKMFATTGTCQTQYSAIPSPISTSFARTQTNTTSTPMVTSMASVSQSTIASTSSFNTILNLMLLTASGSFNVMQ